MAAQMPLEDKARRAAFVVDNTGPLARTYAQADDVLDAVCAHFGLDPARYAR
jgi:dephospho-CoA kinase